MSHIVLKANSRGNGKKAVNAVRNSGKVPGVYYIYGGENISLAIDPIALRPIVHTSETKIFDLEVDGKNVGHRALLKDVKFHPVTDQIVHFDLFGLREDKKISAYVPIKIVGTAAGVRTGGILQQVIRKVKIKCFPKDLPSAIEVDVTALNVGDSIGLKSLAQPSFEFAITSNPLVVSIAQSRASRSAQGN